MKAEITKDGKLNLLGIDMFSTPIVSGSQKSLLLASTGAAAVVEVGGKAAKVQLNVFVTNPAYQKPDGNGKK